MIGNWTTYNPSTGEIISNIINGDSDTLPTTSYIEGTYPAKYWWVTGGLPVQRIPFDQPNTFFISSNGLDKAVFTSLPNPTNISVGVEWDGVDDETFSETSGTFEIFSNVSGEFDVWLEKPNDPMYMRTHYTLVVGDTNPCLGRKDIFFTFPSIEVYNPTYITLDDHICLYIFAPIEVGNERFIALDDGIYTHTFNPITPRMDRATDLLNGSVVYTFNNIIPIVGQYITTDVGSIEYIVNDVTPTNAEITNLSMEKGTISYTINELIPSMAATITITSGSSTTIFNDIGVTN